MKTNTLRVPQSCLESSENYSQGEKARALADALGPCFEKWHLKDWRKQLVNWSLPFFVPLRHTTHRGITMLDHPQHLRSVCDAALKLMACGNRKK